MSEKEAVQMWFDQFGDKKIKGHNVWKWVKEREYDFDIIGLEAGKLIQYVTEENYTTWQLTPEALEIIKGG